jgi:hypothetical protein
MQARLKRRGYAKISVFRVPATSAFALQIDIHPSPASGAFCTAAKGCFQPCSTPPAIFVQNRGAHISMRVPDAGHQSSESVALSYIHLITPSGNGSVRLEADPLLVIDLAATIDGRSVALGVEGCDCPSSSLRKSAAFRPVSSERQWLLKIEDCGCCHVDERGESEGGT